MRIKIRIYVTFGYSRVSSPAIKFDTDWRLKIIICLFSNIVKQLFCSRMICYVALIFLFTFQRRKVLNLKPFCQVSCIIVGLTNLFTVVLTIQKCNFNQVRCIQHKRSYLKTSFWTKQKITMCYWICIVFCAFLEKKTNFLSLYRAVTI